MDQNIILIVSNALTAVAGWFVGRRRASAETDNQVLRNLELSINLYKQIIDSLKVEIQQLNIKIQELEAKVDALSAENKKLKKQTNI